MNLNRALLLAGGAGVGVIVLAMALVLTGSEPMAEPDAATIDQYQPDPQASGVVVTTTNGSYYTLTPSGELGYVTRPAPSRPYGVSPDLNWQATVLWDDNAELAYVSINVTTSIGLEGQNRASLNVRLPDSLVVAEWAPEGSLLAALDEAGNLYLIDPGAGEANPVAENVTSYVWGADDRLVFAVEDSEGARLFALDEVGRTEEISALSNPISRFYPSPQREKIVFTQDDPEGWQLLSLDPASGEIEDYSGFRDLGWTGGTQSTAPELAIAWSPIPDYTLFAVGPVSEPYVMYLFAPSSKWGVRTYSFEEGYAGELVWSPDGKKLAISTYSPDRTQHEVYVMNVIGGLSGLLHLSDGCKIAWSPDGKFVAVKREPHDTTGVSAIRVDNGFNWLLTDQPNLIPVAWGTDEQDALARSAEPVPYAVQLGK